jgi:DNA helicase-4
LDKTFRFNNKIGEVAAKFVTQNPAQLEKTIHSHRVVDKPAVSLIKTNIEATGIYAALSAISQKHIGSASVLILARFHFKKPDISSFKRQYSQLNIQFMTVHAAKGKEADYVIILGLEHGKHGFPSEKATHPLLEMLLPKAENFKHAEERRLFYVALTRAKHHVYLISDGNKASCFIHELARDNYEILTDEFQGSNFQQQLADTLCEECKSGYMVARKGPYSAFFGCNQYPLCNHTQNACQRCGSILEISGQFRLCKNPTCDFVEPVCPKCGGSLILRKGSYGSFWGCANYRQDAEFSCTHTDKYIDLKAAKTGNR